MPDDREPVFVAGGAGYLGSHIVLALLDAGLGVAVLDDFSTGSRHAVDPRARLIEGSLENRSLVRAMLDMHRVRVVVNAAGMPLPAAGDIDPLALYRSHMTASLALIECAAGSRVSGFVQISSLMAGDGFAVARQPQAAALAMAERALLDGAGHHGLALGILRLPELVGLDPLARTGHHLAAGAGLVQMALQSALGQAAHVVLPPSPPGEPARHDVLHVADAAGAAAAMVQHLAAGRQLYGIYHCDSGQAWKVTDLLALIEQITNVRLIRRAAAPPDHDLPTGAATVPALSLRDALGWKPAHTQLETILRDAYARALDQLRARTAPPPVMHQPSGELGTQP